METIGKYSIKRYACDRCGKVTKEGTNHWGRIYNMRCSNCSWHNPLQPFVSMSCKEKMPKGFKKPAEWTMAKLGDLANIKDFEEHFLGKDPRKTKDYLRMKMRGEI